MATDYRKLEIENLTVWELRTTIYTVLIDYFPARAANNILARIMKELKCDITEKD